LNKKVVLGIVVIIVILAGGFYLGLFDSFLEEQVPAPISNFDSDDYFDLSNSELDSKLSNLQLAVADYSGAANELAKIRVNNILLIREYNNTVDLLEELEQIESICDSGDVLASLQYSFQNLKTKAAALSEQIDTFRINYPSYSEKVTLNAESLNDWVNSDIFENIPAYMTLSQEVCTE
jgi:hypothetical protein